MAGRPQVHLTIPAVDLRFTSVWLYQCLAWCGLMSYYDGVQSSLIVIFHICVSNSDVSKCYV